MRGDDRCSLHSSVYEAAKIRLSERRGEDRVRITVNGAVSSVPSVPPVDPGRASGLANLCWADLACVPVCPSAWLVSQEEMA
jgi:hypothetical protein